MSSRDRVIALMKEAGNPGHARELHRHELGRAAAGMDGGA